MAVTDLDGDGRQHLVVANSGATRCRCCSGTVGSSPADLHLAYINGDGALGAVTANTGSATVSVLLGNSVSVLLGNGAGGLGAASSTGVAGAGDVAMADLDDDGRRDVAVTRDATGFPASAGILLGTGSGGFSALTTGGPTEVRPTVLAVADLNGDGNEDLVSPTFTPPAVSILLGAGPSPRRATCSPTRTARVPARRVTRSLSRPSGAGPAPPAPPPSCATRARGVFRA